MYPAPPPSPRGSFRLLSRLPSKRARSFGRSQSEFRGNAATFRPQLELLESRDLLTVTCVPDTGTVVENQSLFGASVLANDTDTGPGPLTAQLLTMPQYGGVMLMQNGSYTYTPMPNFVGTDQFTYQATDGACSDSTSVTITVTAQPVPVANNQTFNVPVTDPLASTTLNVTAADSNPTGYPMTPEILQFPQNGWANVSNGEIVYTPNLGFAGTDSFTYEETAGPTTSNVATVTLDDVVQPGLVITLTDGVGIGSLRDAIIAANAGGASSITFRTGLTGTITLTSPLETITANNVSICGPVNADGTAGITVARSTTAGTAQFGIFDIGRSATCFLNDVNITNGSAAGQGGGISNAGTLYLSGCLVDNNTCTGSGGGIYNTGYLVVSDCIISYNTATGSGGGIYNGPDANDYNGGATILGATEISDNTSYSQGGGIFNNLSASMSITGGSCQIDENQGVDGGGVANSGTLTMAGAVVSANWTTGVAGVGGGFFNEGTASVINVLFTGNTATDGGGFCLWGSSTTFMTGSTVTGNNATSPTGYAGYDVIPGAATAFFADLFVDNHN